MSDKNTKLIELPEDIQEWIESHPDLKVEIAVATENSILILATVLYSIGEIPGHKLNKWVSELSCKCGGIFRRSNEPNQWVIILG